ncbi:Ion channel [Cooperia oncophora]
MEMEKWSFGNALIFTFSVITTIGYGHIAPETFYGRLFVIFFGLVGVPLTLLTVADLGMFFSILLRKLVGKIFLLSDLCKRKQSKIQVPTSPRNNGVLATARDMKSPEDEEEEEESSAQDESQRKTAEAIALSVTFVGYLMLGAKVLSVYEPEMDFFKALFDYLFITFCYTGIGLALTTMAIEMAADLLRKVHYVGRKMVLLCVRRNKKPPSVMQGALTYSKLRDSSENDILFVDERLGKYYGRLI